MSPTVIVFAIFFTIALGVGLMLWFFITAMGLLATGVILGAALLFGGGAAIIEHITTTEGS